MLREQTSALNGGSRLTETPYPAPKVCSTRSPSEFQTLLGSSVHCGRNGQKPVFSETKVRSLSCLPMPSVTAIAMLHIV